MPSQQELVACVNAAFDAVNASKVGPIMYLNDAGEKTLNNLAMNTYYYVLQKIVPGSAVDIRGDMKMGTEKEPWQE